MLRVGALLVACTVFAGACSSDDDLPAASSTVLGSTTSIAPNTSEATSSTVAATAAPSTTAAPTTVATTVPETTMPETTVPPATDAPTTTTPTSIPATGPCPGDGPVPAGATDSVTIDGDIDGDAVADEVTSYSLAGVPHVHARLAIGQQSDVELPLGFADTVQISFEDFDHSLGAPTPPPVAVLAIGAGNAGSAFLAFLTLTRDYCIQPWTTGGSPFSIRVSQQGPYTGLFCDRGAGQVHYSVVTAEQQTGGDWLVTTSEIKHNFTAATLNPLPDQTVPDSPGIPSQYGDIVNCDHAPLFP